MAEGGGHVGADRRKGWRRLGTFWLGVLFLLAAGGAAVEWLGRPRATSPLGTSPSGSSPQGGSSPGGSPAAEAAHKDTPKDQPPAAKPKPPAAAETLTRAAEPGAAGQVAGPDSGLLERTDAKGTTHLPRIAADGRTPMRVYAAAFDGKTRLPRAGLLLAGIGLNAADTEAAIRGLPAAVSLAVSPYGGDLPRLLALARAAGHEFLISIPMEPMGYPLNDPGPEALLVSAPADVNLRHLHWALSRIDGYAGATAVIGPMRGERLAGMADQMDAVLAELAGRGLLYIDPREGRGPVGKTWGRHIELTIDEPADWAAIDARLAQLEQMARDNGSALGLVLRPAPVALARIAAWANGLADRGVVLAPVSALVMPPVDEAVRISERH